MTRVSAPPDEAARTLLNSALNVIGSRRTFPSSTYRLQFHAGFTFRDATAIVPYLRDLGISHLYASPYLKAAPGSSHGYDTVDHNQLNPELGSEADFDQWISAMREAGLQHVLDIVPNHMGVGCDVNTWWNDVLTHGRASPYAEFFDIAWSNGPRPGLVDKVLLPVLGEPYGETLEKGLLRLSFEEGRFLVAYYDRRFPISDESSAIILEAAVDGEIERAVGAFIGTPGEPKTYNRLHELLESQHYRLAHWRVAGDEINYRRFFDINQLAAMRMERPEVFEFAHRRVFKLLVEGRLAGVRIDHPDGLRDPRQYLNRLQRHYVLGVARELYIEANPFHGANWELMRRHLLEAIAKTLPRATPERWPLYSVAEKILAADEPLPHDWPVHGTTGYDYLIKVNGLFVYAPSADAFTRLYESLTGEPADFPGLVYAKKRLILDVSLAGELTVLVRRLDAIAQRDRRSRDITLRSLHRALREVIACFPVYRSYVTDSTVPEVDARRINLAVKMAMAAPDLTLDRPAFEFLRDTLLQKNTDQAWEAEKEEQNQFIARFQQLTAPLTAKGIEDTAFYLFHRLISLNEVGGDPDRFGTSTEELHQYLQERASHWPYAMSCLSTHDTKRSEDVRARINVLSELPELWGERVRDWREMNSRHRRDVRDQSVPDPNEEYLLYQTLVGVWPIGTISVAGLDSVKQRVQAFMEKALREAKQHTSWTDPNAAYEKAVKEFVDRILSRDDSDAFLSDFVTFQKRLSHYGLLNSLSQTVLRLTTPGVPDTYQGSELWDFSLVDPDNRRPVDYGLRQKRMADMAQLQAGSNPEARRELAAELLESKDDGRIKLFVTTELLKLRQKHVPLFGAGDYVPLEVNGPARQHAFAFARRSEDQWALVVVSRFHATLARAATELEADSDDGGDGGGVAALWSQTWVELPGFATNALFRDVFTFAEPPLVTHDTGSRLNLGQLFETLPFAVLVGRG